MSKKIKLFLFYFFIFSKSLHAWGFSDFFNLVPAIGWGGVKGAAKEMENTAKKNLDPDSYYGKKTQKQMEKTLRMQPMQSTTPTQINIAPVISPVIQVGDYNIGSNYRNSKLEKNRSSGISENINQKASETYKWTINNKPKVLLAFTLLSYLCVQLRLKYLSYGLNNSKTWSKWQNSRSIKDWEKVPATKFCQMLLNDIKKGHEDDSNLDITNSLSNFINQTDAEVKSLYKYAKIISYLKKFYIARLFWYDDSLYNDAYERAKRLSYIRTSLLNWLYENKLSEKEIIE